MRITFTCNNLNNGGAERVICNLANQMVKDGFDVRIICLKVMPSFYYPLDDKVEVIEIDKKNTTRKSFVKRKIIGILNLYKLIQSIKGSTCVISFYSRQNCYSILACRLLNIKIICSERDHFFLNDGKVNEILRRIFYPLSDGFIHQTNWAQCYLRQHCNIRCRDVVIHNPLWITEFPERTPQKGYILSVGRLDKQKNYSGLINAFAEVHKVLPYTSLHIFGEGPLKEQLKKQCLDLGIQDSVVFEGISKNIVKEYVKADIFTLFSHGEGYPNVLLEALALGVPSIASDSPVGGPREMIENNVNGLLIPCSDEKTLADSILYLLQNDERKNRFSSKSISIRETNEFKKIYNQIMDYILGVVDESIPYK
ncbi:glycosyltransferase [Streptococcus cristatus]|uniref:glycosyltransferase n=1 Tax=Streptococcus cristatus TaxID=45634 RepID=UPI00066143B1|nr:glycosyltransferase [Streptococcus cristatus]